MWNKIKAFLQNKVVILVECILIAICCAGLIIAGVTVEEIAKIPALVAGILGLVADFIITSQALFLRNKEKRKMMLCTLASLKTYLGITGDTQNDFLTMLIKQNSAMIENYLGYPLQRKENSEVHNVNNDQLLILDCQPIQSVSEVKIGDQEIEDYKIIPKYAKTGMLYRGLGWCGQYYTRGMTYDIVSGVYEIEVEYISGYFLPGDEGYTEGAEDSLPYDIMSACILACAESYNIKLNNAEGIKSYSEGGQSTTFADGGTMADCGLSAKICSMLVDYRRQAVA